MIDPKLRSQLLHTAERLAHEGRSESDIRAIIGAGNAVGDEKEVDPQDVETVTVIVVSDLSQPPQAE